MKKKPAPEENSMNHEETTEQSALNIQISRLRVNRQSGQCTNVELWAPLIYHGSKIRAVLPPPSFIYLMSLFPASDSVSGVAAFWANAWVGQSKKERRRESERDVYDSSNNNKGR